MSSNNELLVEINAATDQLRQQLAQADSEVASRTSSMARNVKAAEDAFASLNSVLEKIGIGASIAGLIDAAKSVEDLADAAERSTARINAQLAATGNAVGMTQQQISAAIADVATSTNASSDQVRQAANELEAFSGVSAETFGQTLKLAQDLAASGFGTLTTNARLLGKAIQDPETGFSSLGRLGLTLSPIIQQNIKDLQDAGNAAGAAKLGLDALAAKVGNSGAADASTLSGSVHKFNEELETYVANWAQGSAAIGALKDVIDKYTASMNAANASTALGAASAGMFAARQALNKAQNPSAANERVGNPDVSGAEADYDFWTRLANQEADMRATSEDLAKAQGQVEAANAKLVAGGQALIQTDQDNADAAKKAAQAFDDYLASIDRRIAVVAADADGMKAWAEVDDDFNKGMSIGKDITLDQYLALGQKAQALLAVTGLTQAQGEVDKQVGADFNTIIDGNIADINRKTEADNRAFEEQGRQAEEYVRRVQQAAQQASDAIANAFLDMITGQKNAWKDLETTFENIVKQMLATALVNPIVQDVIFNLAGIGSSAGLLGGSSAGGVAGAAGTALGGLNVAGGVGGVGSLLGVSLGNSINTFGANYLGTAVGPDAIAAGGVSLTSLLGAGALGALGGGLFANLVGGNQTYGSLGGGAGALIGLELGGPIGALAGGLLGSLASLFGPGPSNETEGYQFDPTTGTGVQVGNAPGSSKFSQTNLTNAQNFMTAISQFTSGLTALGGSYTSGRIGIDTGNVQGTNVYDYDKGTTVNYSDPTAALQGTIQQIIGEFTGLPADVQTAIKNIDWTGDLSTNLSLLQFAANFQATIKAMEQGTLSVQDNAYDQAAAQVQSYVTQITQFLQTTQQLGLSTDDANTAVKAFVDNLVDGVPALDAIQTAVQTATGEFSAMGPLFAIAGEDASQATEDLNKAIANIAAGFDQNLQSEINSALGDDFLNSISADYKEFQQNLLDAGTLGESASKSTELFDDQLASIITNGSLTADQLNLIVQTFGDIPDVVSAANNALAALNDTTTTVAEDVAGNLATALQAVQDKATQTINDQLSLLQDQQSVLQNSVGIYQNVADAVSQAQESIQTNSSTSTMSNQQRLQMLLSQLDSAYAAYQGGDTGAGQTIADLAQQAATANSAYNASSEAGAEVQEHILDVLANTGSVSGNQLQIAQDTLTANEQQVTLLQEQLALFQGSSSSSTSTTAPSVTTPADLTALTNAYGATQAAALTQGMSLSDFVSSPVFSAFQGQLVSDIGTETDTSDLLSDFQTQQGRLSDPTYGASAGVISDAISAQLHNLGVPGFATGGTTGSVAFVHPGELLYTGPSARVFTKAESSSIMAGGSMGDVASEVRALTATVAEIGDDHSARLAAMNTRLMAIETNASLNARYR